MESRTDDPKSLSTKRSKEQLMLKNRPKGSCLNVVHFDTSLDSRWRQQDHSIAICRPIYTAGVVISLVFLVGCVFIPLGIWCLLTSDSVKEVKLEYTNCSRIGSSCELNVKLETDFSGNVYFYYGLTNYFQNARRYLRSWNPEQLTGNLEVGYIISTYIICGLFRLQLDVVTRIKQHPSIYQKVNAENVMTEVM